MQYLTQYFSPIGPLTLAAEDNALTAVCHQACRFRPRWEETITVSADSHPVLAAAAHWLDDYFTGLQPAACQLPLRPEGTPFQQEVWQLLQQIPYGCTTTYGTLAKELARRHKISTMSAQAVGNAVGRNPIAILIPCHRVIGADGSLVGYASGLNIKAKLLHIEGAVFEGRAVQSSLL